MAITRCCYLLIARKTAVVPRSPDCQVEALQAVYNTKQAIETAKVAMAEGDFDVEGLVERLRCVRYVSTMVIEQLDAVKKTTVLSKPRKTKK
jgi:hypothetical protein